MVVNDGEGLLKIRVERTLLTDYTLELTIKIYLRVIKEETCVK